MKIPASLDGALGFNITRVALLFRRELIEALRGYHLTPEQWQILVAIIETEQIVHQSTLSDLTLKDTPNISRILKRMERDGWIERAVDVDDARSKRVIATSYAREAYPDIRATLEAHFDARLRPVAEETEQLMRLLHRLRGCFEADPLLS
ncbi:MAG: MarR family transcriptional regulator [Myxococcota bacterium]